MKHITQTRLVELSRSETFADTWEDRHLEACAECSSRLAKETRLTASFERLAPLPDLSELFVLNTTLRFRVARIRATWSFIASATLALVLGGAAIWLLAITIPVWSHGLVELLRGMRALLKAFSALFSYPEAGSLVTVGMSVVVIACATALLLLARDRENGATLKYSSRDTRIPR